MTIRLTTLAVLAALLASCITEGDVDVHRGASMPKQTALEFAHKRVEDKVSKVQYQSGNELLKTLQDLVEYKEVAMVPIINALPTAESRTRANLLYVLSFLKRPESHDALVRSLADENPVVRYEAASGLIGQGDMSAIPVLIGFLESNDRRMRYKAFTALSQATGEEFGYDFNGDPDEQVQAIGRWRGWWTERRRALIMGQS
jgi:HEAT repeat protein